MQFANTQEVEKPKSLSEVNQLKAEVFKLKAELAQCRINLVDREAKLASSTLSSDQGILEALFKKELGCKPEQKFNWSTLKCDIK